MMGRAVDRGRRRFLKVGVLAGAGLIVAGYAGFGGEKTIRGKDVWGKNGGSFTPNVWVQIRSDETVIVRVNHSEIGQGTTTALPMILAEELAADWTRVRFEITPIEAVYKNPTFNSQMTAASTGVRTSFYSLLHAGAAARQMLILAAARGWRVDPAACDAASGTVFHRPSGRSATFGSLVSAAATLPLPETIELKSSTKYELLGKAVHRLDGRDKATGVAVFGVDVVLPDLLHATVVHPPVFGSRVGAIDASRAEAMNGVRVVTPIDEGVAVVADSMYHAFQAARMVKVDWENPPGDLPNTDTVKKRWIGLAEKGKARAIHEKGDAATAMAKAPRRISAVYELPFQAHATPEPMNCTAFVRDGKCEIWAPTQSPDAARELAARITGLGYNAVKVHVPFVGAGFGRRITVDYVAEAVELSKRMKRPVKVVWTREEDIRHDRYRPASYNVIEAGIDDSGLPTAWRHRIVGPDHMAEMLPLMVPSMMPYAIPRTVRNAASSIFRSLAPKGIAGKKIAEGAEIPYYGIENVLVEHIQDSPGVPTGFWRSVAFSSNTFVVESFIDEIAGVSGKDPFTFRCRLLESQPRLRHVLSLAAEKAGWEGGSRCGRFQGMACLDMHETLLACIAEISPEERGGPKVRRLVFAVDCGTIINPGMVRAQIEGGAAFGLTATIKGRVTIKDGQIEQANLNDFPLLRMDEMPEVEVHLVASDRPPTGIGEMGVPLVAPAVANAFFGATGKRVRALPINVSSFRGRPPTAAPGT
jgi:isoquinoline 1-oxidoreductase subunit beta